MGDSAYDILAFDDASEPRAPSLGYAARLAIELDAALTGLCVCPSPTLVVPPTFAPEVIAAVVENTRELEDLAEARGPDFLAWVKGLGVSRAAWQVGEGDVPHVAAHAGNWHDLLVLGRSEASPWGSATGLGRIVLTTDLPCLVVPSSHPGTPTFDCIALAWNSSPEAMRAIHAARPLLARAKRVVILRGAPRYPLAESGWRPPFELAAYLARHGIAASEHAMDCDDEEAGPSLLDAARDAEADLLVMGAYGRTRLSEWILGGATRDVLEQAGLPVLMRH